jgi:surfactin family lipopeptide synthetase A
MFPQEASVVDFFREQAGRQPDAPAVQEDGRILTYRALDLYSNRVAHELLRRGLKPEETVAVFLPASGAFLAAVLGVLKAGGTYFPVATDMPDKRLEYLLTDSQSRLVLSDQSGLRRLPAWSGKVLEVARLILPADGETERDPQISADPRRRAYITYTSGSTGQPKGVMVEHVSAVNYLHWAQGAYLRGRALDCALFTSMAFDLTLTSFFLPLLNGNRLYLHGRDDAALEVAQLARDPRLGLLKLTPAHLALLADQDLADSTVKVLIVGGEELKTDLARRVCQRFAGHVELYNEYGPTEATVGCMIYRHDPDRDQGRAVPIGVPAANTALYLLDGRGELAPPGAVGELYISGLGVARGYHRRPELTAQRFLPDPFRPGWRMYRTGDRARLLPDGNLDYLGRLDHQVKLRGYRIEPEEIACQLARHPQVAQAQVLLGQDGSGQACLLAYFSSLGTPPPAAQLREFLAARLPRYMLPSWFIPLQDWPLTANGKLDRAALPAPPEPVSGGQAAQAPASALESLLCRVWGQVLGGPGQELPVGVGDNFFDLGGDSIKAMQIVSRLSRHGLRVAVGDVLRCQSVGRLARQCAGTVGEAQAPGGPLQGPKALSPMEGWLLALDLPRPGHFNQTIMLETRRVLDPGELETALASLVARHDGLRLNLDPGAGRMFFNPAHLERPFSLTRLAGDDPGLAEKLATARGGFDLERDLLLRAALIEGPGAGQRLLLCAHHLVVDAVSWGILLEDLAAALGASHGDHPVAPPPATASLSAWQAALEASYDPDRIAAELAYWKASQEPGFILPLDHDPPDWRSGRAASLALGLDREETERLRLAARQHLRADIPALLVSALAQALAGWCGVTVLALECEGHGRLLAVPDPGPDVARTVGWFTALYPLRLEMSGLGLADTLVLVKERLAGLPNHGLGHGLLRHCLARPELAGAPLIPQVRLNYLGDLDVGLQGDIWTWRLEHSGLDSAPENPLTCKLEVLAMLSNGCLNLRLIYNQQAHDAATMERLAGEVLDNLRRLAQPRHRQADPALSPNDFSTARLSAQDLDELFK